MSIWARADSSSASRAVSEASTWRRASAAVEAAASAAVLALTMDWSRWNWLKIG